MATFFEDNQVRLILNMSLYQYGWYNNFCDVTSPDSSEYTVLVSVR